MPSAATTKALRRSSPNNTKASVSGFWLLPAMFSTAPAGNRSSPWVAGTSWGSRSMYAG